MPLLRTLAEIAAGLLASRQPVGATAIIVGPDGLVLVALHRTRPSAPWGLPGGWLHRGELPEDGVLREVAEELDVPVSLDRYVCSYEHWNGRFRPRGLSLAFRLRSLAAPGAEVAPRSWEVAATRWLTPAEAEALLGPDEVRALRLATETDGPPDEPAPPSDVKGDA